MRLLFCKTCCDVIRLHVSDEARACVCGRTSGYLTTKRLVTFDGPGIILGIDDSKLERALSLQPDEGRGPGVFTFVMPRHSPTVNRPSP